LSSEKSSGQGSATKNWEGKVRFHHLLVQILFEDFRIGMGGCGKLPSSRKYVGGEGDVFTRRTPFPGIWKRRILKRGSILSTSSGPGLKKERKVPCKTLAIAGI